MASFNPRLRPNLACRLIVAAQVCISAAKQSSLELGEMWKCADALLLLAYKRD